MPGATWALQDPEATAHGSRLPGLLSAGLLRLLDPDGPGRRCEDAGVAVVPTDAQARRFLADDLFDDAPPRGLRDTLGFDHDSVSGMRSHCATSSARLYGNRELLSAA